MAGICARCFNRGVSTFRFKRCRDGPFFHRIPGPLVLNPFRMEIEKSMALLQILLLQIRAQLMGNEGLTPSADEEIRRSIVVDKLREIVMVWAKRVAFQRRFPKSFIRAASATVLVYGSYGLGVHNYESDIDALCVGPCFATMAEDFFIVLRNMLASRPEVTEILCVTDARVPLMRLNFDGISIDLTFARLNIITVPENVNLLDPLFSSNVDEISFKSLSGVCANMRILQLVPNLEVYRSLLRCVKFWAKRRGIYGNVFGYFGGIHLAVLAAFVCLKQPTANLNDMIRQDFDWQPLFEPFPYAKKYSRFLKICLSCSEQSELGGWEGWVKSRIHILLLKLEEIQGFCDPNPTEYVDVDILVPNVIFCWGLCPGRSSSINIESIKKDFTRYIYNEAFTGKIDLSVVKASEFPKMKADAGISKRHIPGYFVVGQ
ncbi:poly(A) polymerase [Striga asiatica]|uniref:polynucleotide adenylyltransferase n=1 Tax=Striga asiatica TaxID=4170 RepID=A0A5A7PES9_STRAF|nr:poly(A) polymerase [Striga asiatica]